MATILSREYKLTNIEVVITSWDSDYHGMGVSL